MCKDKIAAFMISFKLICDMNMGAQWLSGRVLDLRPSDRGFEHHQRHCVLSLTKTHNLCLVLVQHRKTRSDTTEKNDWDVKNQIKQTNKAT